MSYTVESINDCTKRILFNIENIDLSKEIDQALKEKQKTANLKGFRKGKAPISMVQKMYGPQVENDALYRFISSQFMTAVQTEGIKAVGLPQFANTKYESGKSVSFEAVVEIFPEFEVKNLDKLKLTKDDAKVTDEDLENVKKQYLQSKSEMVEVKDKVVENGLFAVINFQGEQENGERPENMKGEEFLLEVGSNTFIPGFEEGVVGMKTGEKKTLDLRFPADYHVEELKEAKVKFEVELLEIKKKKMPELTDELAKEVGFESAADFEIKNKERLELQKEREVKEKLHQEILETLIKETPFEVPIALVQQQEKAVQEDLAGNLKMQGFDEKMLGEYFSRWADDIKEKAVFQVKSGLILDQLATQFSVESTDEDVEAKFEEMTKSSGLTRDQIDSYYKTNDKIMNNLRYAIREEKTFEKICEQAEIK